MRFSLTGMVQEEQIEFYYISIESNMKFLEVLGVITSILGFLLSLITVFRHKRRVITILICILTFALAIIFYRYTLLADEKIKEVERRELAKSEALELLVTIPQFIFTYDAGQNKAIAYQALFYLDKYNDLFPRVARVYTEDILSKMEKAENESSEYKKEELLRECAESARQLLLSLSH